MCGVPSMCVCAVPDYSVQASVIVLCLIQETSLHHEPCPPYKLAQQFVGWFTHKGSAWYAYQTVRGLQWGLGEYTVLKMISIWCNQPAAVKITQLPSGNILKAKKDHVYISWILLVKPRVHNTKNRECPTVDITHTKSLRRVFCNPLYIFEKQSIPFTGSEALLIAVD